MRRASRLISLLLLLMSLTGWVQHTVQGRVFGGSKEPLPFANVFLSGTTKGTLTNAFTLTNIPSGSTVGLPPQRIH